MRFPPGFFLAAVLFMPTACLSQPTVATSDKPIQFDVAVFRLNKSDGDLRGFSIPVGGDGFTVRNRPMFDLIRYAFGRADNGGSFHIDGQPDWVNADNYDVQAKIANDDLSAWQKLNAAEQKLVLQRFLIASLKLTYHPDTASHPYYAMVVGKSGINMQDYKPDDASETSEGVPVSKPGVCHFISSLEATGHGCRLDNLANILGRYADRPILNRTGLTAAYNFDLHFDGAPDPRTASEHLFGPGSLPRAVATDQIRQALRQIGLELTPAEGPLDGIVIDHIERPPGN